MKKSRPHPSFPGSPDRIILALTLLFLFRLGFGLCSDITSDDPHQTYLIGLKYFCTNQWPYYGPDVVENMQIPGALEGLMVGLPLKACPIPESPFFLLNLLSFGALCLLAWYFSKRLPPFPRWLLWGWLMTAPWTLDFSTNILNVSYVLFGSAIFFVGFFESIPAFSLKMIPSGLRNFMMGFALLWIYQFHLSYTLLIPFVLAALYFQAQSGIRYVIKPVIFLSLGCLVTGSLVLPTFVQYGLSRGMGGTQNALAFNPSNALQLFVILARYLSLASCEIPRWVGTHNTDRLDFLKNYPLVVPFAIAAFIFGILQPLAMLYSGLKKNHPQKDWPSVKLLTLSTFLLLYMSFLFTIKTPASHTYYLILPLVMLYAFYAFIPWVSNPRFLWAAKALLVCNLVFHLGLAWDNYQKKSLYQKRDIYVRAIAEKNYHLVGERRANPLY